MNLNACVMVFVLFIAAVVEVVYSQCGGADEGQCGDHRVRLQPKLTIRFTRASDQSHSFKGRLWIPNITEQPKADTLGIHKKHLQVLFGKILSRPFQHD